MKYKNIDLPKFVFNKKNNRVYRFIEKVVDGKNFGYIVSDLFIYSASMISSPIYYKKEKHTFGEVATSFIDVKEIENKRNVIRNIFYST